MIFREDAPALELSLHKQRAKSMAGTRLGWVTSTSSRTSAHSEKTWPRLGMQLGVSNRSTESGSLGMPSVAVFRSASAP